MAYPHACKQAVVEVVQHREKHLWRINEDDCSEERRIAIPREPRDGEYGIWVDGAQALGPYAAKTDVRKGHPAKHKYANCSTDQTDEAD